MFDCVDEESTFIDKTKYLFPGYTDLTSTLEVDPINKWLEILIELNLSLKLVCLLNSEDGKSAGKRDARQAGNYG